MGAVSPSRPPLRSVLFLLGLLLLIFAKYGWDHQQLQGAYSRWLAGAPRPPAPPAVSGMQQKTTEEGIHDR